MATVDKVERSVTPARMATITGLLSLLVLAIPKGTVAEGPRAGAPTPSLPLAFVENAGQWREPVRFAARRGRLSAHFERDGIVLLLLEKAAGEGSRKRPVRMSFEGASGSTVIEGEGLQAGYHNFFLGDPSRWRSRVAGYSSILYRNLYTGIDLRARESAGEAPGLIEYDLIVDAGADPAAVTVQCKGVECLEIAADGSLIMDTGAGVLRHSAPLSWQVLPSGERRAVASRYVLVDPRRFGFDVIGHDSDLPLVIDPGIIEEDPGEIAVEEDPGTVDSDGPWSTYLGGFGVDAIEGVGLHEGEVIVAGYTDGGFPSCADSLAGDACYDATHNGFLDGFVARLSADGTELVYSTYLGGDDNERLFALVVNEEGEAIVAGYTWGFPIPDEIATSVHAPFMHGENDIWVVRLSSEGDRVLYATYLGGPDRDVATHMAPWGEDGVCITGFTGLTGNGGFETRNLLRPDDGDVLQPERPGAEDDWDAFVCILRPDAGLPPDEQLVYSTYLGGAGEEGHDEFATRTNGRDIVADADGIITVVLHTRSDLPTTADAVKPARAGGYDAYLARIDPRLPAEEQLVHATYLGGSANDFPMLVTLDAVGRIFVAGATHSTDFPIRGAFQGRHNGAPEPDSTDAFLVVLEPGGAALRYGTFFGGELWESPWGLHVGEDGTVTLAGWTTSMAFPVTPDAPQPERSDPDSESNRDAFILRLDPDPGLDPEDQLRHGTFLGGAGSDAITGCAVDEDGDLVVAGWTSSTDFPTTEGVFQEDYGGGEFDGFVARVEVIPEELFRRGDANADGSMNIADAQYALNFLFLGGPAPRCFDAADANDDGAVNIADPQYALNYQFLGGPAPPSPGVEDCGPDPSPEDMLDCAEYPRCP